MEKASNSLEITLDEMQFYAYHGHYEEEKVIGNRFLVSVTVRTTATKAVYTDELSDGLDYRQLYDIVASQMKIPSNLIEHVAQRIIRHAKEQLPSLTYIQVKISKCNPPVETQTASVTTKLEEYILGNG